jgi:urea transport system permease protein
MHRLILAFGLLLAGLLPASAQDLQPLLQTHAEEIASPSRNSVGPVLDDLVASGHPGLPTFLQRWSDKGVWQQEDTGTFFYGRKKGDTLTLTDIDSGAETEATTDGYTELRPNGGVRRVIGSALVEFQLSDPDLSRRAEAVNAIARRPSADQLEPLLESLETETYLPLRDRKRQVATFLVAQFSDTPEDRIAAIEALAEDTSVDARSVLSRILSNTRGVATVEPEGNIASIDDPMEAPDAAYTRLVEADLAPARVTPAQVRATLEANVAGGEAGGVPLDQLGSDQARARAYGALVAEGAADPLVTEADRDAALEAHVFYTLYDEDDPAITDAASASLQSIQRRVGLETAADLGLDALSLASIYFLAAVGLAITFGVMGVINMAHGEFIMMGAYTGYVVQQFIRDYTLSIVVALPLAFALTFAAGVALERLVIRHLYHRPLETLLATFGISIALQQLAKNIFGTQARPLTSPDWLGGAWVITDVVQISYIRIAIFVLALLFLGLILFVLKRTRLGLEVRAVTQNPGMAASMGINPDRINMLTFGLGSGIAGIAGVAIGLYAKVTSEMGSDYIVQSFMTVVVGGVGNVWGTLAGASLIGFLQKGIEWFNPSNTLAAQTYMILFIILFIQFRPRGIIALRGRAAAD